MHYATYHRSTFDRLQRLEKLIGRMVDKMEKGEVDPQAVLSLSRNIEAAGRTLTEAALVYEAQADKDN